MSETSVSGSDSTEVFQISILSNRPDDEAGSLTGSIWLCQQSSEVFQISSLSNRLTGFDRQLAVYTTTSPAALQELLASRDELRAVIAPDMGQISLKGIRIRIHTCPDICTCGYGYRFPNSNCNLFVFRNSTVS
jgi:hypothetical protein